MARIPIKIEKIIMEKAITYSPDESKETVRYFFEIEEKGKQWVKTHICNRDDLIKFRNEIDKLIEATTTAEALGLSDEKARILDDHYNTDPLCQNCIYKLTPKCKVCLFILQSPLERQLYLALSKAYIKFHTQYPLNWHGKNISIEGKKYEDPINN